MKTKVFQIIRLAKRMLPWLSIALLSPRLRVSASPRLPFFLLFLLLSVSVSAAAVGEYEGRPIESVEIVLENASDAVVEEDFLSLVRTAVGREYSAVSVRGSLDVLFRTDRIANARVEVIETGPTGIRARPVRLRYIIKRLTQVERVEINVDVPGEPDSSVSKDELRARLISLEPGSKLTEQVLRSNADSIQVYLRDKGFFNADVEYTQEVNPKTARATVEFNVNTGQQSRVDNFEIDIKGFDASRVRPTLKLQPGEAFLRTTLSEDIKRIRDALIAQNYLAPKLDDTAISRDEDSNRIKIKLTGTVGPKVSVEIKELELSEKRMLELLPVKRDGTIDQAAIVEGERRLQNRLQEEGYFFASVRAACSATPAPSIVDFPSGTRDFCQVIDSEAYTSSEIKIVYNVNRGRRFKLTEIRLQGTDKLSFRDVESELKTRKANVLGYISKLGYGRGYTSRDILREDQTTIEARMRDLGYRKSNVAVRQGASINGDNLIITFAIEEGPLTRVAAVEIRGNQIYTEASLRRVVNVVESGPYSRSQARTAGDRILKLYVDNGYVDAALDVSTVELPKKGDDEQLKIVYTITNEGDKVFINKIFVTGNLQTKREAIIKSIPLKEGDVLRADELLESERILYTTDAFRQVTIRTEYAGETDSGFKKRDVIINVEELKPRILTYGGGYSTDGGPLGIFDIRNVNFFGALQQGALRTRISRRQQLLRLEYLNPRFMRYAGRQFSPLTLSLQYTRDTNVTRFFRSVIDKGASGIVQRLDKDGNPIDEFGASTGAPTINRLTFSAETQRIFNRETRSIAFFRYRFEDVRLFQTESLLIAPILENDRRIRLSGFGGTYVRDTRENCTGDDILSFQGTNGNGRPCSYSASDATGGEYLTFDYAFSLKQLGGSVSLNKLQGNYQRYYQVKRLRGTVFAGRVTLGLASLFNVTDRDRDGVIDEADRALPISERFFSGGSYTLRGFDFEEAGPRRVVPTCYLQNPIPANCGVFRNRNGDEVTLSPFTVPIGGNAIAIVNLESRIPLTTDFHLVPFYDGGNVFRRINDLFNPRDVNTNDIGDFNLRSQWTNTFGLGLRLKTPIGGAFAVDYGYLVDSPRFLIPQNGGSPAEQRLKNWQLHFRFSQAF